MIDNSHLHNIIYHKLDERVFTQEETINPYLDSYIFQPARCTPTKKKCINPAILNKISPKYGYENM